MILSSCMMMGLLALFMQGSSAGHMLLVEHVRCAEHGELIHGTQRHSEASSPRGDSPWAAVDAQTHQESDEAHVHCALSSNRREAPAPIASARVRAASSCEAPLRMRFACQCLCDDSSRFRVAPKSSPPA